MFSYFVPTYLCVLGLSLLMFTATGTGPGEEDEEEDRAELGRKFALEALDCYSSLLPEDHPAVMRARAGLAGCLEKCNMCVGMGEYCV